MNNKTNKNKKILITDDSQFVTKELQIIFAKIGYQTLTANSAEECIALCKDNNFDFIILDLFMPDATVGYNLLNNLKKNFTLYKLNTEIIVMSAGDKNKYENTCKDNGADYYIEKTEDWRNNLINIIDEKDK